MGKRHMKRLSAPNTWPIPRKVGGRFIIKPAPGGQRLERTLPLGIILRDILKKVNTRKELKIVLNKGLILVNERKRKKENFPVGLFDTIHIPVLKEAYRLTINKGKLSVISIDEREANLTVTRIKGKTFLKSGKIQLNLENGWNILSKKDYKIGDTVLLDMTQKEIKEVLPLEKGYIVFIDQGKHSGLVGELKDVEEDLLILQLGKEEIRTKKEYGVVIGKDNPIITLTVNNK